MEQTDWQRVQELEELVRRDYPDEWDRVRRSGEFRHVRLPSGDMLRLMRDAQGRVCIHAKLQEIRLCPREIR